MRGSGWATVTDCSYVYQAILEESNLQIHFMENSLFFEVFNSQVKKKICVFRLQNFFYLCCPILWPLATYGY